MASDRQQFNRAVKRWNTLRFEQAYSIPDCLGRVAIICSTYDAESQDSVAEENSISFSQEAKELAIILGDRAELVENAKGDDIRNVLTNPYISSIVTIGNGALPYLYIENGQRKVESADDYYLEVNDRFDWRDVLTAADHLKLGHFIQRHCGNYTRELSVPLGTFAMATHQNVWAPVGQYFHPANLRDPENDRMRPVCENRSLSYDFIKDSFSYKEFLESTIAEDSTETVSSE